MPTQEQLDKLNASINGVEKSTNCVNSELRFMDICNRDLPDSISDIIGKFARNKGIPIAGIPNTVLKPMLKFDSNGKITGGSIFIEVRF